MLERLAVRGVISGDDVDQIAGRISCRSDHRMEVPDDRVPETGQTIGDGIDKEGCVIGDDLNDRSGGFIPA